VRAITKLKQLLDGESEDRVEYRCRNCDAEFEIRHFTCPSCESYSVERVTWDEKVQ